MEELYYGLENLPARNPTMEEARLVQVVDHFTDITHHPPGLCQGGGRPRLLQGLCQPAALGTPG